MKNAVLMTSLAAAIMLGGTLQGLAAGKEGHMRQGPRDSFEELDANGDGQVTQQEMAGHMQARFRAADADGNDVLSRDELMLWAGDNGKRPAARMVERMLQRHDADGNG